MSVRDGELAGNDRPRARQEPAACEVADVGKDADEDDELDDICRRVWGRSFQIAPSIGCAIATAQTDP